MGQAVRGANVVAHAQLAAAARGNAAAAGAKRTPPLTANALFFSAEQKDSAVWSWLIFFSNFCCC